MLASTALTPGGHGECLRELTEYDITDGRGVRIDDTEVAKAAGDTIVPPGSDVGEEHVVVELVVGGGIPRFVVGDLFLFTNTNESELISLKTGRYSDLMLDAYAPGRPTILSVARRLTAWPSR